MERIKGRAGKESRVRAGHVEVKRRATYSEACHCRQKRITKGKETGSIFCLTRTSTRFKFEYVRLTYPGPSSLMPHPARSYSSL